MANFAVATLDSSYELSYALTLPQKKVEEKSCTILFCSVAVVRTDFDAQQPASFARLCLDKRHDLSL